MDTTYLSVQLNPVLQISEDILRKKYDNSFLRDMISLLLSDVNEYCEYSYIKYGNLTVDIMSELYVEHYPSSNHYEFVIGDLEFNLEDIDVQVEVSSRKNRYIIKNKSGDPLIIICEH